MKELRFSVKIAGAAIMSVLSVILQSLPLFFLTRWFMRIDLVAVPWILCWLVFGLEAATLSLFISIPLVGILGPSAGGWVGAFMKAVASIWMFLVPALVAKLTKKDLMNDKYFYTLAVVLAIILRDLVCIVFNLYFAIPLFFGMSPEQTLEFFSNPRFQSFISSSLGIVGLSAYILEVSFWNTIQGFIDAYVALLSYILVRKYFH